jgi:NAD(P)H-dependent flavin oxidoreductase YrpB (nitropropane dioxygenase family)
MEERGTSLEELLPIVAGEKSREALRVGDIDNSLLACGQAVGLVRQVSSVKEVVERVVEEAAAIYEKLGDAPR